MLRDLEKAKIVITNYHAFLRRETLPLSKGGRALLQGPGPDLRTKETEGQILQRVMPGLMGMKRVLAFNDEAHHCYREKPPGEDEEGPLKGDARKEADKNREAARVWISGLEAVQRKLGLLRVIDLSATPFFLRGSGYAEGTLFPWTASDFSLMDAIECGIVKLRACRSPTTSPAATCRNSGTCGSTSARRCRSGDAARRLRSIRSACRSSSRPRSMHSTGTTRRPSSYGGPPCIEVPPALSSSATTPRPRSWSTTTSRASTANATTAPPR